MYGNRGRNTPIALASENSRTEGDEARGFQREIWLLDGDRSLVRWE